MNFLSYSNLIQNLENIFRKQLFDNDTQIFFKTKHGWPIILSSLFQLDIQKLPRENLHFIKNMRTLVKPYNANPQVHKYCISFVFLFSWSMCDNSIKRLQFIASSEINQTRDVTKYCWMELFSNENDLQPESILQLYLNITI